MSMLEDLWTPSKKIMRDGMAAAESQIKAEAQPGLAEINRGLSKARNSYSKERFVPGLKYRVEKVKDNVARRFGGENIAGVVKSEAKLHDSGLNSVLDAGLLQLRGLGEKGRMASKLDAAETNLKESTKGVDFRRRAGIVATAGTSALVAAALSRPKQQYTQTGY